MFKVKFDLPGGLTMDEWIEKNMQRNAHRGGAAGERAEQNHHCEADQVVCEVLQRLV